MVLPNHFTRKFLAASVSCLVLASTPHAQTAAPASKANTPVAPYRSAFDSYRPYTDDAITNWKAANDTTARIGGWREYARQAQQPDNTPSTTPPVNAGVPTPRARP
jgi:hypothetical protein